MMIHSDQVMLETRSRGTGEAVLLLPFLGRSMDDFEGLMSALAVAGFKAIGMNYRGIGESTGPLEGLTLEDYADDAARVLEAYGGPAHLVGYTFGGRVARMLASRRPELVKKVVLLSAGGKVAAKVNPIAQKMRKNFLRKLGILGMKTSVLDVKTRLEQGLQLRILQNGYFAPGNPLHPSWAAGWSVAPALSELDAMEGAPRESWWSTGSAPVLVLQGADDKVAPPENGYALRDEFPARVKVVTLPNAGHALLAEQPGLVAMNIVRFLRP